MAKRGRTRRAKHARALEDQPQACSPRTQQHIPASSWAWGAKRTRTTQRPNPAVPTGDWANLTSGPAGLIAERALANGVADLLRFRAVCRAWRACSADPRAHGVLDRRFLPRHWVMLGERMAAANPHRRRFLNVSTGECVRTDLPELRGHNVFSPTAEGLLVLLDRATHAVRLLNPLTRHGADLPPATTLPLRESDLDRARLSKRWRLEVTGAGLADDDSTVAVHFACIQTVAVARPGDERWTVVDRGRRLWPAMSFAGRFYCATMRAVMVVETTGAGDGGRPPRLAVAAKLPRALSWMLMDTVHLVDVAGELMLVDRVFNGRMTNPRRYEVYRVDLDAGKIVPVRGLGGRAVFIGIHRALCVSPSVFPSLCADAVYLGFDGSLGCCVEESPVHLMDDRPDHLTDGTAERHEFRYSRGCEPDDECLSWCVTGYSDSEDDDTVAGCQNKCAEKEKAEAGKGNSHRRGPRCSKRVSKPNAQLFGPDWVNY